MGGGASQGSIEGLLATTMMVGRALQGIYRNPGMYRLQDFHSSLAPRLKSAKQQPQFVFFGGEDSDNSEDEYQPPDPIIYEHLFCVSVGEEIIYMDDCCAENEAGWTPLHTCSMSFHNAAAGAKIVDEMVRRDESLDGKTTAGPGTFNKGWTALHMACAYNVEPLVLKLLAAGADPNTMNSFGYSPLLEACHRGYMPVVQLLLKHGANVHHVPPDELSAMSPFAAAPAHSALGESARCGFVKIVELLLEHGAELDVANSLGWTPLHEACFYNRREVAEALITAGANACLRTQSGALAYHLSGLEEVRGLLATQGGPGCVPADDDTVNMLNILHEITVGASRGKQDAVGNGSSGAQPVFTMSFLGDDDDDEDDDEEEEEMLRMMQLLSNAEGEDVGMDPFEREEPRGIRAVLGGSEDADDTDNDAKSRESKDTASTDAASFEAAHTRADAKANNVTPSKDPLLHSGPMLGNLPSLAGTVSPEAAIARSGKDLGAAMDFDKNKLLKLQKAKEEKKKRRQAKQQARAQLPADLPQKFLCQLSMQPMQQPVQSVYGNVFEHGTIQMWFQQQGQVCPLTGAPLVETDLKPMPELQQEILDWTLNRGKAQIQQQQQQQQQTMTTDVPRVELLSDTGGADDGLYDF